MIFKGSIQLEDFQLYTWRRRGDEAKIIASSRHLLFASQTTSSFAT
jgi:hypothetical protein